MNKPGDVRNAFLIAGAMLVAAFILFQWFRADDAAAYRQQHCILVLGHWLSVEKTTNPAYCQ